VSKLRQKGHAFGQVIPAQPRHLRQCGNVLLFVEPVPLRLFPEEASIGWFVIKNDLPGKYIAYVPAAHDQRGGDVPHIIFAFIEFELSRSDTDGQFRVASNAVLASFGVHSVEICTDTLPVYADQHLALHVDDGHGDVCDGIKIIDQRLQQFGVYEVGEFQILDGRPSQCDRVIKYRLNALLLLLQRLL
jgi:hypothetical protein